MAKAIADTRLSVRLTPNGGRDAIDAWERDAGGGISVKARVSAAPEGGKANKALVALLAKSLKLPKTSIEIVSGETARMKNLRIAADPEVLMEKLARFGQ
jgi:uncharacterized protein (TIGR00251 family)